MRWRVIAALASLCVTAAGPASADGDPDASLLIARDGALWRLDVRMEGKARKAKLRPVKDSLTLVSRAPTPTPATRLVASSDGRAALVTTAAGVGWADLTQVTDIRSMNCKTVALAPGGQRAACLVAGADVVIHTPDGRTGPRRASKHVAFLDDRHVVTSDRQGVWATPLGSGQRRLLAPHAPDGAISVAPDGKRAVGIYDDRELGPILYTFKLDGKATRRRLLKRGAPVAWSRDARWLLVDRGKRTCIVRAVGGQYKCWRGYRGAALSADGQFLVLVKPRETKSGQAGFDLYAVRSQGVSVAEPLLLLEGVDGPAVWLARP